MRELSEKYIPLVEKLLKSNLSARTFSEQNGIKIKTLYHWKKKYLERNKANAQVSNSGFTALSVVDVAKETEFIIQYTDGTRLVLSGSSSAAMVKQFIPAFNK
jgi:hypothetical protein